MQFFHSTTNAYDARQVLCGSDRTYPGDRAKFEDRLAALRGPLHRDRRKSLFVTSTEYCARVYLEAQFGQGLFNSRSVAEPRLYRVECEDLSGHPMALLELASRAMRQQRPDQFKAIASEYWSPEPKHEWHYFEFLAETFTVVEELDRHALNAVLCQCAWEDYIRDQRTAKTIFGLPTAGAR